MKWDKLIELYTLCVESNAVFFQTRAMPPTQKSIQTINEALKISLPPSFLRFAEDCPLYGIWFASLGEDYESSMHILELNRVFHEPGDEGDERTQALPCYLIMINHGHDGDCDCLDTRHFHEPTKEYRLQCWNERHLNPETFDTFQAYIESHVQYWMANLEGSAHKRARAILNAE